MLDIDDGKLKLALEIANPDLEITDIMVLHMHKWCEYQIDLVRGILEGRYAPTWKDGYLELYQYPTELATAIGTQLEIIRDA